MALMCNQRKAARHLWSAMIVATTIGCAAFIYYSLSFGKHHHSETRQSGDFTARQEKLTDKPCIPVCDSGQCVKQSNSLLKKVDPSVNPCENFFEFVCGKYLEKINKEESDAISHRVIERYSAILKDLLENIEADPNSASGKMKTVYDSCMKKSSDLNAIPTVLQFLTQSGIPHWPNLESDFRFDDSSRYSVLSKFLLHQEYSFAYISAGFRDNAPSDSNATIMMNEGGVYENKEKSSRKYLVQRVSQYFSLDAETTNRIWNESEAISDAITRLQKKSNNESASSAVTIDCVLDSESEWKTTCEFLKTFVDMIGEDYGMSKRFADIERYSIFYLQNIFSVLDSFSDRSIANYLAINLLLNHLDELNFYFRVTLLKDPPASSLRPGRVHIQIGRWQHCSEWIQKNLFLVLGHEYMKKDLNAPLIGEVEDLLGEILRETVDEIDRQEWLPESHRGKMKNHTESLQFTITDVKAVLLNDTLIDSIFEQFYPLPGSFIRNVLEYQRYFKTSLMEGRFQALGVHWISTSIMEVQAYAGPSTVEIGFGLLHPPLYSPDHMRLINLVSLSTVIAHEIGHNLEVFFGKLMEEDETVRNTINEAQICLNNQYSEFRYQSTGININASRYLSENFADLIAVSIIDKFIEKHAYREESLSIPVVSYLPQQMLYISTMQVWCAWHTEEDDEYNSKIDIHSLAKFRLIGMMQNSKGFAKAFNCSEGSYMNPPNKCALFRD